MHVRDPKVQRSDFITSSLLHNEHPKFSLFKLDKHIILGVTNNLRFLDHRVHFFHLEVCNQLDCYSTVIVNLET